MKNSKGRDSELLAAKIKIKASKMFSSKNLFSAISTCSLPSTSASVLSKTKVILLCAPFCKFLKICKLGLSETWKLLLPTWTFKKKRGIWSIQVRQRTPENLAFPKYEMSRTAEKDQVPSINSIASTGLTAAKGSNWSKASG